MNPASIGLGPIAARLAMLALCTVLPARALASDALDEYRTLPRDQRERVLACARAEIEHACTPSSTTPPAAAVTTPAPQTAPTLDWPGPACGVYLSLARGRSTRACVGSLTPLAGTLGATLRELARRVVADDPRHPPVRREELDSLVVLVSFAGAPEPISDPMIVAPAREGLLIASPSGSIAFLPGEARTVSWALREARRVGVLGRTADASFQKFAVVVMRDAATVVRARRGPLQ
jgi:AMMECR1 domain-containing protein